MDLHNKTNKKELKLQMQQEGQKRITLSFYRYVIIENPEHIRNQIYAKWNSLNVLGRVYLAREGINAQITVPEKNWDEFVSHLFNDTRFNNMPFNFAVEDNDKSFYKLVIKVKRKIVADGLPCDSFDVTNVGTHLTPEAFNKAMEHKDAIVVDFRNHYESEVGHFVNAICPDADTFKQELPMVLELLKDKKDKKILLYCTGGIRCEKASAYLKHHDFKDVNQLKGGIISYSHAVKKKGLESKFIGKNFVFDERMGEKITDDVISNCHQCGAPCNIHVNCSNEDCHLLFIQCEKCAETYQGCCTPKCKQITELSVEEQRILRKGRSKKSSHAVYKSRLRPNLRKMLEDSGG